MVFFRALFRGHSLVWVRYRVKVFADLGVLGVKQLLPFKTAVQTVFMVIVTVFSF